VIAGIALALLVSFASAPASADEESNTIRRFCMAAFEAAMANAGLAAPEGMGTFTCDCFLDQVSKGEGLNEARETCKTEAAQRFPVDS
jgi:hypothetical protein|tara:strand:- start:318 stop:581 length:264 start_codon:yes stop_codon:yes gene_type:complete